MKKGLFILIISILFFNIAKAENPDSVIAYFKNSGKKVDNKDSADFYRIILPPDTNLDKDLYRVYEYYSNGKRKSVATSLTDNGYLVLDGSCINYFPNGKRKSNCQYKNGHLTGIVTNYYPDGKLYNTLKVDESSYGNYNRIYYGGFIIDRNIRYYTEIIELRDSTGNLLVVNGKGHMIIFNDDFKKVQLEGDLNNNRAEGEWKGLISDTASFTCTFHKGIIKSGISHTKSGKQYNFKRLEVSPVYSDGMDLFVVFIRKNVRYPESARKHKVEGNVVVQFYVETDGTVSGVTVVNGLMKSIDDEAMRVIRMSPPWVPGSVCGIPTRMRCSIPISFHANY